MLDEYESVLLISTGIRTSEDDDSYEDKNDDKKDEVDGHDDLNKILLVDDENLAR